MYNRVNISLHEALAMAHLVVAELDQDGRHAAVAIVDAHGELVTFARTDGCPLSSISIAMNKAFTAARTGRESREIGEASREENFPMSNYGDARFVSWGGGVPLLHEGNVVGGIGVSGLPSDEDMALAHMAISGWLASLG
jgi:glc operon protein GlcG